MQEFYRRVPERPMSYLDSYCARLGNLVNRKVAEAALVVEKNNAEKVAEAAAAANLAKTEFLSKMTHELRTPLNAIIGYSEMMLEDAEDEASEERIADLHKVLSSGQHLLGLIDDILDVAKIEAGKIQFKYDVIDLDGLLRDVERIVTPAVDRNRNTFTVAISSDIGNLVSDPLRLRQILMNLLSNAAKFTHDGEIQLLAERLSDGAARIQVKDSGIGMCREYLEELFEPFSQADNSITGRFGGTGLGLAISLNFAQLMGGRIEVESEPDVGSCFTLLLPATSPECAEEPAAALCASQA